jgi:hypothetical protein
MLAVLLAVSLAVQAPLDPKPLSVDESHDHIRNESKSVLTIGRVYVDPEEWRFKADLAFARTWEGVEREALKPADLIQVVIVVRSLNGGFEGLDKPDLAILAGESRLRDTKTDRTLSFDHDYTLTEYEVPGSSKRINVVNTVRSCCETLTWNVAYGDLIRVFSADANLAHMSVGKRRWVIEQTQYTAIRRWLAKLAVAEAEVRKAEEASEKAQDEHLAPYRADVRAAVEKARIAKRSVPKQRYATLGEKLQWRTLDREMEAVVKKHNLQPKDVEALLSEYPDFSVRHRIQ